MQNDISTRSRLFEQLLGEYKGLIAKVCYVYSSPTVSMEDLYQEVAVNLWQGIDKFRGDAKISTWIYRTAINTCITWVRRDRHRAHVDGLDAALLVADDSDEGEERMARYKVMHAMIAELRPLEKAIITMWLDDTPYADIAAVTGLSVANVATRLHRIKEKLTRQANQLQ